jgi:hypothetical protein
MTWLRALPYLAVIGGVIAFGWMLFSWGEAHERAKIEKENVDAANKAEDWRERYDACVGTDRVFNFETGKCQWVGPGLWKRLTGGAR